MGRVLMTYADASKHKNRSRTDCPAPVLLPAVGLEPTRGYPQQILSLHRLPFRHAGTNKYYTNTAGGGLQEELSHLRVFCFN